MGAVLAAIAMTPSAPVLVPGLAGSAAAEVAGIRDAALTAAAALPDRWIAVGVGPGDQVVGPAARGTFAGFGVDIPVALSPQAPPAVTGLPLCALWAGWLRGQANPDACVEVRVYDADHGSDTALGLGRELWGEVEQISEPIGVLVVADGANTLTEAAPGGFDPRSRPVQDALDDALAAADTAALARLPGGIVGRVAYQVAAGLAESTPWSARQLYRGAPYGVGYFVGLWRRSPRSR